MLTKRAFLKVMTGIAAAVCAPSMTWRDRQAGLQTFNDALAAGQPLPAVRPSSSWLQRGGGEMFFHIVRYEAGVRHSRLVQFNVQTGLVEGQPPTDERLGFTILSIHLRDTPSAYHETGRWPTIMIEMDGARYPCEVFGSLYA